MFLLHTGEIPGSRADPEGQERKAAGAENGRGREKPGLPRKCLSLAGDDFLPFLSVVPLAMVMDVET